MTEEISTVPVADGPPAVHSSPAPRRKSRFVRGLLLVLFLVALGAVGAASYLWQQIHQQRALLQQQIAQAEDKIARLHAQLLQVQANTDSAELAAKVSALSQQQAMLERALRQLYAQQQQGYQETAWKVSDLLYLLNAANQRLVLSQDVEAALEILQAADKRLAQNSDPRFISVRERLLQDIQLLRDTPRADIVGMSLRLGEFARHVDSLPLQQGYQRSSPPQAETTAAPAASPAHARDVRESLAAIWAEMKQLVVIRRNDGQAGGLLAPEQRYFLYANLRLYLESARVFLLRRETQAFRDALQNVQNWLHSYFDQNAAAVQHMQQALAQMATQELAPPVKDISATLQALQALTDEALMPALPAVTSSGKAAGEAAATAATPTAGEQP